MKIEIQTVGGLFPNEVRIGNVYSQRGGRGGSLGYMNVVIAITEPKSFVGQTALMLVVDKDGMPISVTKYGLHYVLDLTPIAFVDGLEDLQLVMRSF